MTGTLVNAAAIAAGGLIGLAAKKVIKQEMSDACMKAVGVAVIFIGIANTLSYMLSVNSAGTLEANGGLLLLISLVLGTLTGELLRINDGIENLSSRLEKRFGLSQFSKGFVNASVLFCAGAMAIVGAFNDGLTGDSSVLFIKSAMDGISSIFLTSTLGTGVMFSALSVFVYQGIFTLLAGLLSGVLSADVLSAISMTGFCIVAIIGLNLTGATKIKTANMIFAILFAALLSFVPWL